MDRTQRRLSQFVIIRAWLGLVGLAVSDVLKWRSRKTKPERAADKMHKAVAAASEKLEKAEREVADATAAGTHQLAERLHEVERSGAKVLGSVHLPLLHRNHKQTADGVSALTAHAGEAIKEASERATATTQQVSEQAAIRAQRIAEQASNLALEKTHELRERITGARGRAPDVQQRLNEELLPMLREVATQAATAALDLWQTARERASEAAEAAQGEIAPRASQASHLMATEAERAREAVEHGGERLRETTASVTAKASDIRERTQAVSKQASTATVRTGRDTGALFLWAGAATALVVFVLMSEERRRQLKELAATAVSQIQQLIQDIQGYDEEF